MTRLDRIYAVLAVPTLAVCVAAVVAAAGR